MDLYILRHGIAVEPGNPAYPRDSERQLTAEGGRKLWRIAKAMEKMKISLDVILSSPYVRARQTAQIIAEALNLRKQLQFTDELRPGGEQAEVIQILKQLKDSTEAVLLVGHEPSLSDLVSRLVSGNAGCSLVLKKGGLCKLTVEAFRPGRCATLDWLLTPKQMALMT